MMTGLDWVAFNVERAIGLRPAGPAAASRARELVPALLAALPGQAATAVRISLQARTGSACELPGFEIWTHGRTPG